MQSVGDDYEFDPQDLIGHGAFAVVYKGRNISTHSPVAIKFITKKNLTKSSQAHLTKEIEILKDLSGIHHENVVQLLEFAETETHVFLVMEYCNGGDLSDYLGRNGTMSEDTVRMFLAQLTNALKLLNAKGILHRDLKPHNILLSSTAHAPAHGKYPPPEEITLKIADFGFARFLDVGLMAGSLCGSPMYMAPEILMSLEYGAKADLFSIGVIVYQCIMGRVPFRAHTPQQLRGLYVHNPDLCPRLPHNGSNQLKSLLLHLLKINQHERMDFETFCKHPFLPQLAAPAPEPVLAPAPAQITQEKIPLARQNSEKDSAYSSFDSDYAGFVIVPNTTENPKSKPIPTPNSSNSPDVRSLSPPRVNFHPTAKLQSSPPSRTSSSPPISGNRRQSFPIPTDNFIFEFEPPELSEETLNSEEHNSTLAKLSFALNLSECVSKLAESKGVKGPLRARARDPEAEEVNVNSSSSRSEQLTLFVRSLHLLSSALKLAKNELDAKHLHLTPTLKKIIQQLNAKLKSNFELTKKLKSNISSVSDVNADRLIYSHAIELCKSAASEECTGGNYPVCFEKYQTAQTLLHSLSQQVNSEQEKLIVTKYTTIVEKRLDFLIKRGYGYAAHNNSSTASSGFGEN